MNVAAGPRESLARTVYNSRPTKTYFVTLGRIRILRFYGAIGAGKAHGEKVFHLDAHACVITVTSLQGRQTHAGNDVVNRDARKRLHRVPRYLAFVARRKFLDVVSCKYASARRVSTRRRFLLRDRRNSSIPFQFARRARAGGRADTVYRKDMKLESRVLCEFPRWCGASRGFPPVFTPHGFACSRRAFNFPRA